MYIDDVSLKISSPAGPDPLTITSFEIDDEKDEIRLSWNAVLGALYAVDRSTALGGEEADEGFWEELDDSIIAEDTESIFIDEGAASLGEPRLFYRVRLISLFPTTGTLFSALHAITHAPHPVHALRSIDKLK